MSRDPMSLPTLVSAQSALGHSLDPLAAIIMFRILPQLGCGIGVFYILRGGTRIYRRQMVTGIRDLMTGAAVAGISYGVFLAPRIIQILE
jgi:hypothetical protein